MNNDPNKVPLMSENPAQVWFELLLAWDGGLEAFIGLKRVTGCRNLRISRSQPACGSPLNLPLATLTEAPTA